MSQEVLFQPDAPPDSVLVVVECSMCELRILSCHYQSTLIPRKDFLSILIDALAKK